ncbi:FAD dependent oxidoreductase [Thelonectria olida]|uniref:FAD dependent oxidoreductase n=1 Tax=Thelonectria olida TaxID=1576542 RepID=A0A9P8VX23_9HYPO|nr:FAD dependent oxidoreductase [Thelonectria olida]
MSPAKDAPIIIIGAGVFGLGLAYELASHRGYTKVTVLDRHMPPVPDGSSVDVSRIIRSEYADPLYSELAVDALKQWRSPEWASQYYESGFVMIAPNRDSPYMERYRAMRNEQVTKQPMDVFESHEVESKLKALYPGVQADLKGTTVLHNALGGWANARAAIQGLATRCSLAGVSFITGAHGTVVSLEKTGPRITGVKTAAGTRLLADTVVLATGAWSNRLVPDMNHNILAVGQPVGFIQLSPEEAKRLSKMPVMINTHTGVFCFPPTPDTHQLKLARHGFGFATKIDVGGRVVSGPMLKGNNAASGYLPEDAVNGLREGVSSFFPEFGNRPWAKLRMCWYTDTPNGDFMVDYHPTVDGLFLATGGSGHAFKFLPVIGKHVADCLEEKASPALRKKWAARPTPNGTPSMVMPGDGSRGGPPMRVVTSQEQAKL